MLNLLVVWTTTRCQLRCRYCYVAAGEVPAHDLDPAVFARALRTLGFARGGEIQIAGGEPGLVPDVMAEVARLGRAAGAGRIGVQTNGLAIDDAFIDTVKRHRLGVGVSLDGPPEVNDRVRGQTARVLAGLARLEAAAVPFGITAVVCRDSVETLPDLVLLLGTFAHVKSIGLDVVRPAGRGSEDDLPSPAAVRLAYEGMAANLAWINRRRAAPIRLREAAAVGCAPKDGAYCATEAGTGAVLTADGRVFPCGSLVGFAGYDCGTADAPDLERLGRGVRPERPGCAACEVAGCRGRCPSRAAVSVRAAALDCVLRRAASARRRSETAGP